MHVEKVFRPPVTSGQSDGLFFIKKIFQRKIRDKANDFNFLVLSLLFLK
jgi:hypothetical protein